MLTHPDRLQARVDELEAQVQAAGARGDGERAAAAVAAAEEARLEAVMRVAEKDAAAMEAASQEAIRTLQVCIDWLVCSCNLNVVLICGRSCQSSLNCQKELCSSLAVHPAPAPGCNLSRHETHV